MATQETMQARIRGRDAIDRKAQELAWQHELVLGRLDWRPNPELEEPDTDTDRYQLTLASDAGTAQYTISAADLENPAVEDGPVHDELHRLVRQLVNAG
jgi:hypothetical protein